MSRSRITKFRTPHRVSILRKEDRSVKTLGRIVPTCIPLILYENVPARITVLREFTENVLMPSNMGSDAGHIHRAMLIPTKRLDMLQKGDSIRIAWGTKPNLYVNPRAILGPQLWITTPGGNVLLTWDNDKDEYNEDPALRVYRIFYDNDRWNLTGPSDLSLEFNNPPNCSRSTEVWPSGYGFIKVTGPPVDYEVLRFEHQEDDRGRYHHTRLEMEAEDKDGRKGQ